MFIKNHNQYLISENLKQARQYLTKKSISLDLPEFTHIVNSLKDTPNLIDTFTRMVFTDGSDLNIEMGKFNQISNWIKSNRNILNQLPKNITQYKSLEELSDDITQLEHDRKVYKFIKSLYRSMRDDVSKLGSEDREEFDDLAISFMNLSDSEKSQFTPMHYFSQNNVSIHEFMDSLDKFINGQDVNDNKKKVYNYIKGNNKLDVVYDKDNVLVIQTNDGESVCELGSQRWCIVYAPNSYQNHYFGENSKNTQYIIYNFNLPSSSRYSMFGVTINIEGIVISGGSQDKSNSFISLDKIYELTGIPEGTLRSVYEEEYKKLKEGISTIDKNSTFGEIREIRELSLKLNKGILTESPAIVWIDYYISSKLSDSEKLDDNTDEYRNKLNIIIEDITSKCKTLGISSELKVSELQNKYLKSLVNSYNLLELGSVDDLISNISSLLKESEDRSTSNFMILDALKEWIVDNTKDRDVSFIISILNKIISGVDNKDVSFSIYTYIRKNKDLFKLIIDEIGNSIESISHYLNENLPLLKVIKIDFSEIIKDRNWISPSSLNEFIIVYYKYVFGIMGGIISTHDNYKYLTDISVGYIRVKSNIIPPIMITLDSINRFKSELKSIEENLLNYDGYNSKYMRWGDSLDGLYSDLIEEYLVFENRSSIEEIVDCFRLFKDSIIEKEPLYLNNNIIQLMSSFESNIDDVYDFVLDYIDDFEIEDVFSADYIDDIYNITKGDIFNMGGLFIKMIESDYIHDIDNFSSDIVMYGAGLHDEEYMNIFRKGIGLKYHEEFKVWYMETDYNTLGDYFDRPYDFEDDSDQFYDSTYGLDFSDYFDYIDISNLYQISSYIKDISESDIDLSILTKYKNDGKWVDYKESMKYYREDSELRKLRGDIEDIINEDDDNIIGEIILNAYNRAYSYARESEYFNDQISVIGYDILTQWESEKRSFGNSFLMWDNNNNIMVIPDLNELFDYEYSYIGVLSEYVSLDDINIDYIIDAYLNVNNKFDWATDDGYTSMDVNNYIDFNDELRHLLGEDDIHYENNITILKLSEYMKIQS